MTKPAKTIAEQVAKETELNGGSVLDSQSLPPFSEQELEAKTNIDPVLPDYSELDSFIDKPVNSSDTSENSLANNSENSKGMSDEDAKTFAAIGVGKLDVFASIYVGESVEIPLKQKEEIADKAAIVIKKHLGGAELPPWLKQWKEEIGLGLALGTSMFTIWQFKQQRLKEQAKTPKISEKQPEIKAEFSHSIGG